MVGNNEFDYSFKQTQFSFLKKSKNKKKILFNFKNYLLVYVAYLLETLENSGIS